MIDDNEEEEEEEEEEEGEEDEEEEGNALEAPPSPSASPIPSPGLEDTQKLRPTTLNLTAPGTQVGSMDGAGGGSGRAGGGSGRDDGSDTSLRWGGRRAPCGVSACSVRGAARGPPGRGCGAHSALHRAAACAARVCKACPPVCARSWACKAGARAPFLPHPPPPPPPPGLLRAPGGVAGFPRGVPVRTRGSAVCGRRIGAVPQRRRFRLHPNPPPGGPLWGGDPPGPRDAPPLAAPRPSDRTPRPGAAHRPAPRAAPHVAVPLSSRSGLILAAAGSNPALRGPLRLRWGGGVKGGAARGSFALCPRGRHCAALGWAPMWVLGRRGDPAVCPHPPPSEPPRVTPHLPNHSRPPQSLHGAPPPIPTASPLCPHRPTTALSPQDSLNNNGSFPPPVHRPTWQDALLHSSSSSSSSHTGEHRTVGRGGAAPLQPKPRGVGGPSC